MDPKSAFSIAMNAANVVVFAAIITGVVLHARRTLHARIMLTCFVADVLMVLVIELTRHAIAQAVGATSGLMRFHIAVSAAALVLWIPQIVTGRRILAGKPSIPRHRVQAWAFLVLRATNLVTAFMVAR
jgi:nitrate reductase gamma subunit